MTNSAAGSAGVPRAMVVMGVCGTGKSCLGQGLARRLKVPFLEGDQFHAPASIAKMARGVPLDDADRWPWLDRLGAALGQSAAAEGGAIAACSALKRAYRERLRTAAGLPLLFICLQGERDMLARRMTARTDHYMPPSLLDSQLATLQPPAADERALILDAGAPPAELLQRVLDHLGAAPPG